MLAEEAGAAYVKTSTGYASGGATLDDLRLMRATVSPHIKVKAAGGVRTLDALIDCINVGIDRCGATATAAIIDDLRARQAREADRARWRGAGSGSTSAARTSSRSSSTTLADVVAVRSAAPPAPSTAQRR